MKCQILFLGKNKKKISICRLLACCVPTNQMDHDPSASLCSLSEVLVTLALSKPLEVCMKKVQDLIRLSRLTWCSGSLYFTCGKVHFTGIRSYTVQV